jgi:hypothetical protein
MTVSSGLTSKSVVGLLVEPQNQGGGEFLGLGPKNDSYGLVIWVSKSPRQFLGLCFKTMHATFYRMHHKIDGSVTAWDTCRDLTTLLYVEASQTRVFQSGLKTSEAATTGGARDTITKVASKSS